MSNEYPASPPKDWRKLAEQASAEPDPAKLIKTISELCQELDKLQQKPGRLDRVQQVSSDDQSGLTEEKTA